MQLSRPRRPLLVALIVFLLASVATASLVWRVNKLYTAEQRALAVNLADDHADALVRSIERALSATYALAVLVRQGKGTIRDFDAIAGGILPLYPGAGSLQLAPRGVVQSIVPLAGNEQAIGLDLLNDARRKNDTQRARDSGKLVFAGPFNLVRGGVGAVGWLPVFLDDAGGKPVFWGFTSVLIHFPEILAAADFPELTRRGFAYELWRIDPNSGQKHIIAASSSAALVEPVRYELHLPNTTWTLSIAPVEGWNGPMRLALGALLGLLFSLLLAYLAKLIVESRDHEKGLEALVEARTAEIRLGEARYRELFEANPQPMWVYDLDTLLFLAVNDAAVAHYGYSRDEFAAMNMLDIRPPEEVPRLMQRIARVRTEDIRDAGLWRHRKKDGSLIDVEVMAHTLDFGGRRAQIVHVNDVTDRLRAEHELRASEERYHALTDLSSDWYWEQDEDLRFTRLSRPDAGLQEIERDTFLGKTRREASGVVWDEPQLAELDAIVAARRPFRDFEIGRTYREGRKRYVQMSGEPIFDASGRFAGYRGIGKDITERKHAEAALHESEERFRSLSGMSSDFYWESDAEHRLIARDSANRKLSTVSMFRQGAQIGERRWDIPHLSPGEAGWRAHRADLDAHLPFRGFELSRLGIDGTERYISISGDPVFDASGGFKGYRGVGADITERRREEQLLRLEHAVARCLAGAISQTAALKTVMRVVCEAMHLGSGIYWRADEAAGVLRFEEFWKAPGSEFERYTDGSRDATFAPGTGLVGRVWQSGEPIWVADFGADPRVVQKDLALATGMHGALMFPVMSEGRTLGVFAFLSRIVREPDQRLLAATRVIGGEVGQFLRRKQVEEQVQRLNAELEQRVVERTHELELANKELEAFSYSVSHDLRAPLRAIQGFARMVELHYASQIDDKGRDLLRRVGAGADKMALLIDDLLRLARISRQAMHMGRVDLSALVREAIEDLQDAEHERRVEWVIAQPATAMGDSGLLRVVLQNLIGNAWKYSSRRELARIEFGVGEKDGKRIYFVRDNGAGFDMAYAGKLFVAFQRLHTAAEFSGSGIGLATVARILHRHGGSVWAEGREDEGATFFFSLG